MSSDNCIAILNTCDMFQKTDNGYVRYNDTVTPVDVYRVEHVQAVDNYEYLRDNSIHELGIWMVDYFDKSRTFTDKLKARQYADELADKQTYLEYGIVTLDAREFNFPGC